MPNMNYMFLQSQRSEQYVKIAVVISEVCLQIKFSKKIIVVGFFLGKTSRKHSGVQNVAELVEILGIYELYRSPTIFLSSSNIS